jgi:hypothetical protein
VRSRRRPGHGPKAPRPAGDAPTGRSCARAPLQA